MNYKLMFKKALRTHGALAAWLNQQSAYRLKNIIPHLYKQVKPMERYYKRTGNDRMLKELHLNIKFCEQRYYAYLNTKKPTRQHMLLFYQSLRDYYVLYLNGDIRSFDQVRPNARLLINAERAAGTHNPELWDGYACYIEAKEFDGVSG